jgi:hypothetical protein
MTRCKRLWNTNLLKRLICFSTFDFGLNYVGDCGDHSLTILTNRPVLPCKEHTDSLKRTKVRSRVFLSVYANKIKGITSSICSSFHRGVQLPHSANMDHSWYGLLLVVLVLRAVLTNLLMVTINLCHETIRTDAYAYISISFTGCTVQKYVC